jgi:peptidoglycan/xylan/chitin deacetylase (PgdA/CDA1 family)
MRVIFSFDYENYIDPGADEPGMLYADLLAKHGLRGCFMVVGERARALRARGRRDVIEALRRHEIAYHTDLHEVDPTPTEVLDGLDWEAGLRRELEGEIDGLRAVEEIFGQFPSAYTQPGTAWAPQTWVALRKLGVGVMTDSPIELPGGRPLWYCDSLHVDYHLGLERYFALEERRAAMRADFVALAASRDASEGVVVITTHPTQLALPDWPVRPTPYLERSPREVWREGARRPREFVEGFLRDLDAFLTFLVRDAGAEVITYRDLAAQHRERRPDWLPLEAVAGLARAVAERVTFQAVDGVGYTPAEIFGLLAHALSYRVQHGRLPEVVPLRRLLGPVESPPERRANPLRLPLEALLGAAQDVDWVIERSGRMPGEVAVAGARLGPGPFLGAMAGALASLRGAGDEPESVLTGEQPDLPELVRQPPFSELAFQGTWRRFPPDFEGTNVLRLARRQAWSARPAVRH